MPCNFDLRSIVTLRLFFLDGSLIIDGPVRKPFQLAGRAHVSFCLLQSLGCCFSKVYSEHLPVSEFMFIVSLGIQHAGSSRMYGSNALIRQSVSHYLSYSHDRESSN